MSNQKTGWVLPVLAVLLVGSAIAIVVLIVGSDDEGEPARTTSEERKADRDKAREQKARQLKKVLEVKPPVAKAPDPKALGQKLGLIRRDDEPASLTPQQRLALKSVLASFYSPDRLADALRNRTAPDYAREVSQDYREAFEGDQIDYGRGVEPVTPEVKEVIKRMGVVKDYVMNMLHTMRPEGQQALQQQMMDRMNDSMGRRIDQLNDDYPFLDIQKVESL